MKVLGSRADFEKALEHINEETGRKFGITLVYGSSSQPTGVLLSEPAPSIMTIELNKDCSFSVDAIIPSSTLILTTKNMSPYTRDDLYIILDKFEYAAKGAEQGIKQQEIDKMEKYKEERRQMRANRAKNKTNDTLVINTDNIKVEGEF